MSDEEVVKIYENAEREYEMLKDRVHDYYDEIQKLKEEIEELREDNYAYHQLMKMQNEREYRSKFLKEFQEEFGKNVLPDYDEIYKRYDKLKEEIEYEQHCNEQLRKKIINLEYKIERLEEDKNKLVHIKATTEFKKYKDGYKYVEEQE